MTKVMCGKIDCEFLGDGYICQKNKIMLGCNVIKGSNDEYSNCLNFKEDKQWDVFVQTLQECIDNGEAVI